MAPQGAPVDEGERSVPGVISSGWRDWTHPGNGHRDPGTITHLVLSWALRTPSWRPQ